VYRNLRRDDMPASVHLCDYPTPDEGQRDPELEAEMALAMTVVRLGRVLRSEHNLKVRQPLARIHVVSGNAATRARIESLRDIVVEELNVKDLAVGSRETELVLLRGKADFKRLGPRLGPRVKSAAAAIAALDSDTLEALTAGQAQEVSVGGEPLTIEPGDVVIERVPREGLVVASEGEAIVALETELTDELVAEGLAREFVNKVQNMRKSAGLEVTDRIRTRFRADDEVSRAVARFGEYVRGETLSISCEVSGEEPAGGEAWDLNGRTCTIAVEKA
jgi:isoleucyl-tRNA synthetase